MSPSPIPRSPWAESERTLETSSRTTERAGPHAVTAYAEEEVWIQTAQRSLEGVFSYPPDEDARAGVLILPPHPRYGGDLSNNVVKEIAGHLAGSGFATLRFNYHGVGRSESACADPLENFRYWSAILESDAYGKVLEDARSAYDWLGEFVAPIHLVGYSFGAVVALRLATVVTASSVAAVALAVGEYRLDFLKKVRVPVLGIHTASDFATPVPELERRLGQLGGTWTLDVIPDTDHFFRGHETEVARRVRKFLGGGLKED